MSDTIFINPQEIEEFSKDKKLQPFEQYSSEWIKMSSIIPTTQKWFWGGMIPLETLTLFAGVGGIGKSLLLLYIAAKTTTGESFKAGGSVHEFPKGSVILLSAEDDINSQLMPKLIAMGADTSKIHYLKSKTGSVSGKRKFIELDKDLYVLKQKIEEIGDVKLIIIDPIIYFIGDIKEHLGNEVANFLNELIDFSKKYNLATILNKHLRKQASGSKGVVSAVSEVGGSGAWVNTPRKCWLISNHPEDSNIRIITQMKDNFSKKNSNSLAYKINPISINNNNVNIETTELVWLDETVNITSDEAIDKQNYNLSKIDSVVDLIYNYLSKNGQSLVGNIRQFALLQGIKEKTFRDGSEKFEQKYSKSLNISRGIKNAKMYWLKEE